MKALGLMAALALASFADPVSGAAPHGGQSVEQQFKAYVQQAWATHDRDQRVALFRKALAVRPEHPDNITIEYRIAVELSQKGTPEDPFATKSEEGMAVYKAILEKYDHRSYYRLEGPDSIRSPQMMVPSAALHVANSYRDVEKRRRLVLEAMRMIEWTYKKRVADWIAEAGKPTLGPFMRSQQSAQEKHGPNLWTMRAQAARQGDVFTHHEMIWVKQAVREYEYTYAPRLSEEIPPIMREIIEAFPDTPMAHVAQERLEQAQVQSRERQSIRLIEL